MPVGLLIDRYAINLQGFCYTNRVWTHAWRIGYRAALACNSRRGRKDGWIIGNHWLSITNSFNYIYCALTLSASLCRAAPRVHLSAIAASQALDGCIPRRGTISSCQSAATATSKIVKRCCSSLLIIRSAISNIQTFHSFIHFNWGRKAHKQQTEAMT